MTTDSTPDTSVSRQDSNRKPNKLIEEQSPYLLQHAYNPIEWYPWCREAFSRAKAENKPIFLSIGYSTCHWCHVMARESFENEEIAGLLNENFVCIKVDREERPDIDQIYMTAVQAIVKRGGWPLSVFLTPDLKPFYGGTYFPPEDTHGLSGFKKVLGVVLEAWKNQNDKLLDTADKITYHLEELNFREKGATLASDILDQCFSKLENSYDQKFGGFDQAPKFPRPVIFNFLLRYYYSTGKQKALDMSLETLQKMAAGGIHDHLGGGFHRYSVDDQWLLPHFEKMLYDQAQLAISYLEAYQISGDEYYAGVARDTLDYVLTRMTSAEGGFYSAEDADSRDKDNPEKHGEGLFYLWEKKEIDAVLEQLPAEIFNFHHGIKEEGNVIHDPHREFTGKNIIHAVNSLQETADYFRISLDEVVNDLAESRRKLMETREERPRPHLDDKIITSVNGLMIAALAKAGRVLAEKTYLDAALRAATFLKDRLFDENRQTLLRRYRKGQAGLAGQLEDYAYLVYGLTELYHSSFDPCWLRWALDLNTRQQELFEDKTEGGFFSTSEEDDSVLVRMKPGFDGAEPAGNSLSALNLIHLGRLTGSEDLENKGRRTIETFSSYLQEYPPILPQMLVAYNYLLASPWQIVIAGRRGRTDAENMIDILGGKFLPHTATIFVDEQQKKELSGLLPSTFTEPEMLEDRATAYICKDFSCRIPITDTAELEDKL
ncbi:MAG: thioredoxin domain-containing protein [Desulfurivibrionaceae bacterium]